MDNCEHDYRVIQTTGEYYLKKCFKCGHEFKEEKHQPKKKTWVDKLLGR